MGYQVRFGILGARAYGIPKSRKRAFIPERPDPMHVFAGPQLNNRLSENSYYAAMKSTKSRASFRSLTVRDTIGDLPPVDNGASKTNLQVLTFMNMNPNPGSERKCKET